MKLPGLILALGLPLAVLGQTNYTPYTFTTLAGQVGSSGSTDGAGSAARFNNPVGVARDASGNLYVGDTYNHTIRRISPAGVVTTLAGLAGHGGSADGTGNGALFDYPQGVAVDSAGNIYVADSYFNTIRKVSPAGTVNTLAGLAYPFGGFADGTGTNAMFNLPVGVAVDSAGNVYVTDQGNNRIRKVSPGGTVSTLAGATRGYADGVGSAASFNNPRGIAVDNNGNVYVAEYFGQIIRKITPGGSVSTFAGTGSTDFIPLGGYADGTNETAKFNFPTSVAVDAAGNLFIGDNNNSLIRKISISGTYRVVTTIAGLARSSGSADGTGSSARFYGPFGVAADNAGYVYVADAYNNTIRMGWAATYLHGNLNVTPATMVTFGAIKSGGSADRTFTIVNFGDYTTITGVATVAAPFNVVSGASYTLSPGQSQSVTLRYLPIAAGNDSTYVYFTGGGGAARQLTGSAFDDPTPTTGTIVGRVTRSDTHAALNGVGISAVGPGANMFNGGSSPGTISGNIAGQNGSFSISGLTPNAHYHVLATPSGQQFYMAELTEVNVSAGQTTSVNIVLTPVPAPNQPPTLTPEQTPVVLVRGTGKDTDWSAGESGYWASFRSALAGQGFQQVWDCNQPDNDPDFPIFSGQGHVINGEKSIEDNGWNLEYYIEQKAKQFNRANGFYPPKINIIAHSMGGLITRSAIMSAGVFSFVDSYGTWVRLSVNNVVMLSTPNAGSPLADIGVSTGISSDFFYNLIGWQPTWPATRDLTTDHIRGTFNPAYNSWPSGVKLYLLGGGGGPASATFSLRTGGKALAGVPGLLPPVNILLPPEQINDGAVTWPSVQGKFSARLLPLMDLQQFTSVPLTPTVSPKFFSSLDHFSILASSDVTTWVIGALRGNVPNIVTPLSKDPILRPHDASDSGTNSLPTQQSEQISTTLFAGMTNELFVISDAATTLEFDLLVGDTNTVMRLKDPTGIGIDLATPASNTNVLYSAYIGASNMLALHYSINNPTTGIWKVELDGKSMMTAQAIGNLMAFVDSAVELIPQTGLLFNLGQDVIVNCSLSDLGDNTNTPVQNGNITALLQFPDGSTTNLILFDDGLHNDGPPNNGVYAAILANVQQAGAYVISYRAMATNALGQPFQRVKSGTFSVSTGNGVLWGDPTYSTIDTNADGLGDILQVNCWVNPTNAGNYILSGELVNAAATQRFAESVQFASDGSGPMNVALIFSLAQMETTSGQGSFHIENLNLFEVQSTGTAWLDTYSGASAVLLGPPKIALGMVGSNLQMYWPVDCLGWELQTQTNALNVGLGTNWLTVPGTTNSTQIIIPMNQDGASHFYRLRHQ